MNEKKINGKLVPFELTGYPVKMTIRRKLDLKPGNYSSSLNQAEEPGTSGNGPSDSLITGEGVEFVFTSLKTGQQRKVRPCALHDEGGGLAILLDFEILPHMFGSLESALSITVFQNGEQVGKPHQVTATANHKLQAGQSLLLEKVIRLNNTRPPN